METRFGGAARDAQHLGDPRQWQIEIEVQDHHGARFWLEARERAIEEVPIGYLPGVIQLFVEMDRREFDLDHAATAFAHQIDARVRHEAMEPMVEGRRVSQPRQAAPCPDQGVLDGVLGEVRITKDEASRGVQARTGRADELGEGLPVASPCPVHESVLVHDRLGLSARPSWPCSIAYGDGDGPDGSHIIRATMGTRPQNGAQRATRCQLNTAIERAAARRDR